MATLDRETQLVQNPALGAGIVWRLSVGYRENHRTHGHLPLPLAFLAIPLLYHSETHRIIQSTQRRTGLRAFVDKCKAPKENRSDLIFGLHDRSRHFRPLTWSSLRIAVETCLVSVDPATAMIVPTSTTEPRGLPSDTRSHLRNASKIGAWFSELTVYEVSTILRVRF